MGLITAGARATGSTGKSRQMAPFSCYSGVKLQSEYILTYAFFLSASWLFTFLGGHQDWRSKAAAEVKSLLGRYSNHTEDHLLAEPKQDVNSLSSRLGRIPLEAWESETPVLDAIIRETTRVAQPHTAMRRNLGPDMHIDGRLIPSGAYVICPFSDIHLDPELYPNPWKFDPEREVVKDIPFAYVGWGGGKWLILGFFRKRYIFPLETF